MEHLVAENRDLREALSFHPELYKKLYHGRCIAALQGTVMFANAGDVALNELAKTMDRVIFPAGSTLVRQDCDLDEAYVISSGEVRRWMEEAGRKHIATTFCPRSLGLLHFYNHVPSRFNAECVTEVVAYRLKRSDLDRVMQQHPELSHAIIRNLSSYIRQQNKQLSTPLLEQKSYNVSIAATSIAAACESFYRSAMNNLINQAITGKKGLWFPNMHVQTPTRVLYINGIKQIRAYCDAIDLRGNPNANAWRMFYSFLPGVCMCPISSVLEASNAPESSGPLSSRWTHGFAPRLVREVLFGIGINQLADFFTERVPVGKDNMYIRGPIGSICAGVFSGYLSHVPHILSTKKLFSPNQSYGVLWEELWKDSLHRVPATVPNEFKQTAAKCFTVLFPRGCVRRSLQISGTFIVINTITYSLRDINFFAK